ncbi:cation transporter [Flavobacterium sp.]|uniref:heavy-metal-associated domain-containing protein n=1 Tax=Flavobacterium sp. TaxID=239 RepID=UPI00333F9EC1
MKKIVVVLLIAFLGMNANAQEQLNKNKKVEVEVNGVCEMCKKRIEKAAYSVKGVKSATWHADHQDLHLIIDETKCTVLDVEKAIAKAGHDTKDVKATDEQYSKIHGCCKYRTDDVH